MYMQREGATCGTMPTIILKLVLWWSYQCHFIVLSTVNLQFQGQFIPTSMRPVLGIVAAYVSYSLIIMQLIFPPDRDFSYCKPAQRIWLRMLSEFLEEELKVLDFF